MTDQDESGSGPGRGALIGLAVVVAIIVALVLVMRVLRQDATIQDCVASGRTNCAPISPTTR